MYTYSLATNNFMEDLDPMGCHIQVGVNGPNMPFSVLGTPFFNGFNAEFDVKSR